MSSNPILSTLDSLAVATFVHIGKQIDDNGNSLLAEAYYRRAVRAAETIYGALHGEVGLLLMGLAAFYRRHGRTEEAEILDERVQQIVKVYRSDLEN